MGILFNEMKKYNSHKTTIDYCDTVLSKHLCKADKDYYVKLRQKHMEAVNEIELKLIRSAF